MSKRVINELPESKPQEPETKHEDSSCEECVVVVPDKKKRGRPKKEKEVKQKKPVGRPKSDTDIKTRRLLYGLTFFSKMLGLTDDEIELKKKELLENIKTGKIDTDSFQEPTSGKDSEKKIEV